MVNTTSSIGINLDGCSSGPHGPITGSPQERDSMRDQRLAMAQQPGTDSFTERHLSGRAGSHDHKATMKEKLADLTTRLPSTSTTTKGSINGSGSST
ncbi:hypothetical protein F5Y00DRAFT_212071 [Daldinia vernicosa]|uniref:uncharacterized protein n=1 Tax=Daldinia vernicosa TaxID=114800 RepID=UPI0020084293|nr:uncharacterized protein F5Y00DRAFT_212071 [Daldinia vernicosa]KAI0844055.1 hypothetical protein F5Y00DRAFT_212071 [Daldinia vernicosa]